jgi:hypothetical protein
MKSVLAVAAGFIFSAAQLVQRRRPAPAPDPVTAKLRADVYYPIIASAITQSSNNHGTRKILYDRAIAALTNKLHEQDASFIMHERRALEIAISRVEARASVREIISKKDHLGDLPGSVSAHP